MAGSSQINIRFVLGRAIVGPQCGHFQIIAILDNNKKQVCYCRNRRWAPWRKHSILKFSHICHSYYNTFYDSLLFIMLLLRSSLFNLCNATIIYQYYNHETLSFLFFKKVLKTDRQHHL